MKTRSDRKTAEIGLTIERVFDAPRELVFAAWTEPERMRRWHAAKDFEVTFVESDPRVGGAWRFSMESSEGTRHTAGGVYQEVVPPERLVFTHAWEHEDGRGSETQVTVTLFDEAGRTRMVFEQSGFLDRPTRDSHRDGWNEAFDHLQTYAERN